MEKSTESYDSWLTGTAVSLAYLGVHSFFYNFDGVACAIAVDLDDLRHLVHGNHLAYGICGWVFSRFWRWLGYRGLGIVPLQVLSSILGGAAAGVFHRLCRRLGFSRSISFAAAGGLAFSYAYWFWSLEAQVYMLAAFFLVLAVKEALAEEPRPVWLGVFQGLAVLGHVEHVMFAPAALLLVGRGRGRYLAALAATVSSAYAAAAVFIIRPHALDDWRLWLLGSAALTPDRSFHWHGAYSLNSVAAWGKTTLSIFTGHQAGPAGTALALAGVAAAALGMRAMGPRSKALLLWLVCYAALIISWEPSTIVYRITDLMALWLLIAHAAQRLSGRRAGLALSCFVLACAAYNWRHSIAPMSDPMRNEPYQEALWIGRNTPADAWVAVSNIDHVYIPYFGGRKPLPSAGGDWTRRRLAGPEPVYIASASLQAGDWAALLKGYGLEVAGRRGATVLYRVTKRNGLD